MGVARLVPFIFNSRDALLLVFEAHGLRFVQDGAPILDTGVPVALVTPYTGADLAALQYVQSGNVMTVVHPSYPAYELTRTSNTDWAFVPIVFGATIAAPTSPALSAFLVGIDEDLFGWVYVVTAIGADGEESLASASIEVTNGAHHSHPIVVSWTAATGAQSYRIYRRPPKDSGISVGAYGFVGVSAGVKFVDYARDPDFAQQPPVEKVVFASTDNYPSAVGYWQQRRWFANTNTNPDTAWASQIGRYANFNISVPIKDDDAITFRLVSDTVDEIRHIVSQGELTLLTEGGEWPVQGDANGSLTPFVVNPRKSSSHGVGPVRPVPVSGGLLFPQALGSTILGIAETAAARYTGTTARDLTLFSTHLFDGHSIVDIAWQQETAHVAWFVREDGVLLGLTYIPDQDLIAWHRHDTDGLVENVCVVPENGVHRVYIIVTRTVGEDTVRYLERFASPFESDIAGDAWFVDAALEYDGRDTDTPTSTVSGLDHLEGCDVAIYAFGKVTASVSDDTGHVVANPLRPELALKTVAAGAVALGASYLRVVVGLPFIADIETLDVDTPSGSSAKVSKQLLNRVGMMVDHTRNVWAGGQPPTDDDDDPLEGLDTLALSTDSDFTTLVTDYVEINTQGLWNTNGRMFLRSIDPTPMTVLSVVPQGYLPKEG